MIKTGITRRQFSTGRTGSAAIIGVCRHSRRASAGISEPSGSVHPAVRRRRASPISPRGWRRRSSATSSGSVSWSRISRGPAASRRRAPCFRQPPDGYTLGLVTNGTSISVAIYKALPFDPVKDLRDDLDLGYVRPRLRHQRGVGVPDAAAISSRRRASSPASSMSAPSMSAARRISRPSCSSRRPSSTSRSSRIAGRPTSSSPCFATTCRLHGRLLCSDEGRRCSTRRSARSPPQGPSARQLSPTCRPRPRPAFRVTR